MDSVSFPPHVSLDGVPREHGLGKASLDGLDLCDVVPTVLAQNVARGNPIRAQTVENGRVETYIERPPDSRFKLHFLLFTANFGKV